ncbi:MAG: hypothetical protein V4649_15680 [Bacteroidota bacterium]
MKLLIAFLWIPVVIVMAACGPNETATTATTTHTVDTAHLMATAPEAHSIQTVNATTVNRPVPTPASADSVVSESGR